MPTHRSGHRPSPAENRLDHLTKPVVGIVDSGMSAQGPSALRIYHGVPKVLDGTAPSWLDLPPGRLSITVRETGLA